MERLAAGVSVWLDGDGANPFIYDDSWGGLASCGCDFVASDGGGGTCANTFPDCPALSDMGNNFGFSFFNDHHFHLGYHLYASAVVQSTSAAPARRLHQGCGSCGHCLFLNRPLSMLPQVGAFDHDWLRDKWELLLLYVRDIANPSRHDPYFPAYRHKDWFLGSSWASGVVTILDQPYPNGRNEESSAEAVAAYEAVALLGQVRTAQ